MKFRHIGPRRVVAIWIGLIYATIPFVRHAREAVGEILPAAAIGYTVMIVGLGAVVAVVVYLRRSDRRFGISDISWLVAVSLVFLFWTSRLMGAPEEAVHFVEYGALGALLFRALDDRVPDWTVFAAATVAGLLVGTVDEIIQWMVPGRYFDFRDILLNGGAVAMAQIVTWRVTRRRTAPIDRSSLRLLCRLAAAEVVLLTFCFAATPQRLARVAEVVPMPHRFSSGADAICEYGFRHAVDRLTIFRSRLDREELARSDKERAVEVGRQLHATRGAGQLSNPPVSAVDDPFGYEIRIHLFSRNRNLHRAREAAPGSLEQRRFMTAAWRENLILEGFFGNTLELSPYRWGVRRMVEVEAAENPEATYVSRVGAHLITWVQEVTLRTLMLSLIALLMACDYLLFTRSRLPSAEE